MWIGQLDQAIVIAKQKAMFGVSIGTGNPHEAVAKKERAQLGRHDRKRHLSPEETG